MLLARLLGRRPGGRPVAAGAAVWVCAAAVVLAGCGGSAAGAQASGGGCTPVTGSVHAAAGPWRAENSCTSQRLYGVACVSALRCEAVGAAGTIVATADGGRTWRAQANPLRGSSTALYAIACVAPSSCYVIARPDTILVTHDGGASWSRHVLSVGVSGVDLTDQGCLSSYAITGRPALCRLGLLDIACVSASVCYAVATAPPAYDNATPVPKTPHAAPSSIWLTSDGGVSWTAQSIPPGMPCNGDCQSGLYGYPLEWVTCLSSGLCRAGGGALVACGHCGFAYAVLVTHGPGQPWTCAQSACAGGEPDAADCPTSTGCYGVQSTNPFGGPNGGVNVAKSSDGGANWEQIGPQLGWPSVLNAITCPTALTCDLAGSGGSIARITNGTIVTPQHSPAHGDLYGIGCADPATCFAVGDDGTILALG